MSRSGFGLSEARDESAIGEPRNCHAGLNLHSVNEGHVLKLIVQVQIFVLSL